MKFIVKIKNDLSQIRRDPNFASTIINVLPNSPTQYNATRIFRSWYFIDELKGWAESTDVDVLDIIEPYDPNENYGVNTRDITDTPVTYDGNKIVEAINLASKNISCAKVIYVEDNKEIPIYVMLKNVNNAFNEMTAAINKVKQMQDIPIITETDKPGMVAKIDSTGNVVDWQLLDYSELDGIPEKDLRYVNQF